MKKYLIGLCAATIMLSTTQAQAVIWSTAGIGAKHIPILVMGPMGPSVPFAMNRSMISELIAASPGKEMLDT